MSFAEYIEKFNAAFAKLDALQMASEEYSRNRLFEDALRVQQERQTLLNEVTALQIAYAS